MFEGETDLFFVTSLSGNCRTLQGRKIEISQSISQSVIKCDFASHFSQSLPSGHISYTQTTGGWTRCVWQSCKSHLHLQWGGTCLETVATVWIHDIPQYTAIKKHNINMLLMREGKCKVKQQLNVYAIIKGIHMSLCVHTWWYFLRMLCISATSSLLMVLITYLLS